MLGHLAVLTEGTGRFTLEELFSDGDGYVVAVHRATGSRPDGRTIDTREAMVFRVEDGRIRSVQNCNTATTCTRSSIRAFWSVPRLRAACGVDRPDPGGAGPIRGAGRVS
jgi:hypothetical protein